MGKKYSAGTAVLLGSGDVVLPRTDDPPYFAMLQWGHFHFVVILCTMVYGLFWGEILSFVLNF